MKTLGSTCLLSILLALLLIQTIPTSSRAAGPWYVSPIGNDTNNCMDRSTTCATINGVLNKPGFVAGDTIRVAIGTYTGIGTEVVLLDKSVILSGGWDSGFTSQSGYSIIDGQKTRRGIWVGEQNSVSIDRFTIQNGLGNYPGGGGISTESGDIKVSNSYIISNTSAYVFGGGIFNRTGNINISNSKISGNISADSGGGIFIGFGSMTIISSTISNNTAGSANGTGGGGGGGFQSYGRVVLKSSTVSNNNLLGYFNGSGIEIISRDSLTLINSTVSGNYGGDGSGIYILTGSASIYNSTIALNQRYGIVNYIGNLALQNSILANNGFPLGIDCVKASGYSGISTSLGYNLIRRNDGCQVMSNDKIGINPNLGPLQNNGGSTLTHALMLGSPAIDAGNPVGCTDDNGLLVTDQRGVKRPQGSRCDIGAYEFVQAIQPPSEVPESDTLVLMSSGMMGFLIWLGWQKRLHFTSSRKL